MNKYFIYISLVFAIGACKKKDSNPDPCLLVECPAMNPTIRFRVVDSASGKDYFFSNPPLYPSSELRVMTDGTDSAYVIADSAGKYMETFDPGPGEHTIRISLPGLKADTIQLNTKYTATSCCTSVGTFLTAFINGVSVGTSLPDSTIFVIRK